MSSGQAGAGPPYIQDHIKKKLKVHDQETAEELNHTLTGCEKTTSVVISQAVACSRINTSRCFAALRRAACLCRMLISSISPLLM